MQICDTEIVKLDFSVTKFLNITHAMFNSYLNLVNRFNHFREIKLSIETDLDQTLRLKHKILKKWGHRIVFREKKSCI